MSLYSRGRTRRSLIDTVAFRAVSQVATMLGYIVMVRGMSKQDFGTFNLLYAFIPVISTVASLGLEQTLGVTSRSTSGQASSRRRAWLVRFVASARFGTNMLLLVVILLAWNHIAPIFKLGPYRAEFMLFCILVLLFFQTRILQMALAAANAASLQRRVNGRSRVSEAGGLRGPRLAGILTVRQRHTC